MTDRTIHAGDDRINILIPTPQLLIRNNHGFVYTLWFAVSPDAPCMTRLYRRVLNGNIESIQVSKRKD